MKGYNLDDGNASGSCLTYVDGIDVAFMERSHMPIRKQTVWEQGEKDELWQRQELISRECKSCPSAIVLEQRNGKNDKGEVLPQIQSNMLISADIYWTP